MMKMTDTTSTPRLVTLDGEGRAVVFPSGIVVFNFESDDAGRLSQILSATPVKPVTFLATKFNPQVFSQAETRNRSFIFAEKFINRADVSAEYLVQWLAEGNIIPMVPGNLQVTATADGFEVETVDPDPAMTFEFK